MKYVLLFELTFLIVLVILSSMPGLEARHREVVESHDRHVAACTAKGGVYDEMREHWACFDPKVLIWIDP